MYKTQHAGKREDFNYDIIYQSNKYGPFQIMEEAGTGANGVRLVRIRFLTTGYENIVIYGTAMTGAVKDPYYPSLYGIACIGNAHTTDEGFHMWSNMIKRCYYIGSDRYQNYGAKGIRVAHKWLCFEYFRDDLPLLPGYELWKLNPHLYHLDKDLLQQGIPDNQKVYSVRTCCFIHRNDNGMIGNGDKNKYYGVVQISNNSYSCVCTINGKRRTIGTYPTPELAALQSNFTRKLLYGNNIQVLNDVPYMDPLELSKYNTRNNPQLYHLIDKENN